ncbi:synaptobrevin homolog YKT6 [Hylaeus anthracinus]|uniref:synaptobrevin homolog YKT6 n=1 Tax=Hylaeus volcanicus TaxID=313075 RepID=UPI0023B798F3|nr:synaptobrevin homolog YKT6 [Hylaeus volcanicus]XP_053990407.1 synaptobrevin homolog YKT6 [Hylaeus volcanicus]XP_053990408.1 synaptobrevin homolog YKT6 [Hylaeus volcanicus]XP_054009622.1 synaptobrevin homolog YKT6 [Hylaeus anthracinus]XP_054009623.1 synaptobrevin homolog YKT6 [Hylaeus anthracinus]XP_054009624.1 synaptobrevin homolog YKT6 [Hylaeus anthracinus]
MVKLYALSILYKHPTSATTMKSAYDVESFSFFQRASVKEFMSFVSKTIVERTQISSRQSVKEGDYMCHVYVRADNLAAVLISDHEYPRRVAHTLITKVMDEFAAKYPASTWETLNEVTTEFPQLVVYLTKYRNPNEADALTKMQNDLDETKIILHNTLEAVLQRGEKLDDLVSKSEGLSMQSKAFYKTARKTNSCCSLAP